MKQEFREAARNKQAAASGVRNSGDDVKLRCKWKHILAIGVLPVLLHLYPLAAAQTQAHVDQAIATPTYINIYWDTNWDLDNPAMPKASIDSITQAITGSPYIAGLAEYGVKSASFEGGFLPDPHCAAKPSNAVGFWAPFTGDSIAAFIQCEHDNGPALFRRPGVILNVILPSSSIESDAFSSNFCAGPGSVAAWHYHGLQNNVPAFGGDPIYTIVLANPSCLASPDLSGLFEVLTHEMVEAATDPYPIDISIFPLHFGLSTETEIADFCEDSPTSFPGPNALVMVSTYWSNSQQKCISGPPAGNPQRVIAPWESLGGIVMGKVSAVSWGSGRLDLFVRGANNAILHKYFDGTNWEPSISGWESLGGATTGDISAVSWGPGRLDVFIRGLDNMVYHKCFDGANWGPTWEWIGGPVAGEVSAASWGPGRLDVFGTRFGDNAIVHQFYDGTHWGPAISESLGGATTGKVSAVSWGSGRLDLFVRGTDNGIYHKYFNGSQWGPSVLNWESPVGGATLGDVAALSTGFGLLDMFVRGTDDVIYHASYNGGWKKWESLGGMTAFDVSAVSSVAGRLDVIVRGIDNFVYHSSSSNSTWTPWTARGGVGTLGPVSAVSWGSGRLDLFAPGTDDPARHRYFDGVTWRP